MKKTVRIILITLGAAAVSVLLSLVGWSIYDLGWETGPHPMVFAGGAVMVAGSWDFEPYLFWARHDARTPFMYATGATEWAVFGLVLGVLSEWRHKGRRLLLMPLWIAVLYVPIIIMISWLTLLWDCFLDSHEDPGTENIIILILVLTPPLLALITVVHALIRNRRSEAPVLPDNHDAVAEVLRKAGAKE